MAFLSRSHPLLASLIDLANLEFARTCLTYLSYSRYQTPVDILAILDDDPDQEHAEPIDVHSRSAVAVCEGKPHSRAKKCNVGGNPNSIAEFYFLPFYTYSNTY